MDTPGLVGLYKHIQNLDADTRCHLENLAKPIADKVGWFKKTKEIWANNMTW